MYCRLQENIRPRRKGFFFRNHLGCRRDAPQGAHRLGVFIDKRWPFHFQGERGDPFTLSSGFAASFTGSRRVGGMSPHSRSHDMITQRGYVTARSVTPVPNSIPRCRRWIVRNCRRAGDALAGSGSMHSMLEARPVCAFDKVTVHVCRALARL